MAIPYSLVEGLITAEEIKDNPDRLDRIIPKDDREIVETMMPESEYEEFEKRRNGINSFRSMRINPVEVILVEKYYKVVYRAPQGNPIL